MTRRLVLSYLAVAAIILVLLEVPLGLIYAHHEHGIAGENVARDAAALASLVEEGVDHKARIDLGPVADHYRASLTGDVEIVDRHGTVLVSPKRSDLELSTPAVRDQLASVLRGDLGGTRRVPNTDDLVAVAPVGAADAPAGAVAVAASDRRVDRRVRSAWLALGALAGAALLATAGVGLIVARSIDRPLTRLESTARQLGRGDLAARAPPTSGPPSVRSLSSEFNTMATRLEELVGAQRTFVADASHQLRSPLTALRLRLENVAAALPAADQDVDAMLAELDRLSRVVDGLLLLARSEGRRHEHAIVDVGEVVASRCDAWSALAEEAGIRLESRASSTETTRAWLVPGHLDQIIDNLVANALEATPAGRSVLVAIEEHGTHIEVHVVDEGRGMPDDERTHAFDRFWRGPGSRAGAGTGLGLSIVRQLARATAAEVELRDTPDGGIDATVRFSRARPTRSQLANSGAEP